MHTSEELKSLCAAAPICIRQKGSNMPGYAQTERKIYVRVLLITPPEKTNRSTIKVNLRVKFSLFCHWIQYLL